MIQRPLQGEEGTSFFFEINNVPVFAGGSNFIPSHSFNTEADERDIKWVEMLAHGGQNMIRMWARALLSINCTEYIVAGVEDTFLNRASTSAARNWV